jgi:hypothetical protein
MSLEEEVADAPTPRRAGAGIGGRGLIGIITTLVLLLTGETAA